MLVRTSAVGLARLVFGPAWTGCRERLWAYHIGGQIVPYAISRVFHEFQFTAEMV